MLEWFTFVAAALAAIGTFVGPGRDELDPEVDDGDLSTDEGSH